MFYFSLIALSHRSTHRCLCETVFSIKTLSDRRDEITRCDNAINGTNGTLYISTQRFISVRADSVCMSVEI